ncbi:MAG: hypothetical protein KKD39_03415, partial [Candidatus Altiarchaeota archaeon]|nr:hypothetical protein [Candidatus Altiarchaeota archaeon]
MVSFIKTSRGFIFGNDCVTALTLYLAVISLYTLCWNLGLMRAGESGYIRLLQERADSAAQVIVETPGVPANWELMHESNVTMPGLAVKDRILGAEKINAFKRLGEDFISEAYGFENSRFKIVAYTRESVLFSVGSECEGEYMVEASRIACF